MGCFEVRSVKPLPNPKAGQDKNSLLSVYSAPYDFASSVHDDIPVFFDLDEFAALHNIDGQKIPAVLTDSQSSTPDEQGTFRKSKVLFTEAHYLKKPIPGMQVRIDGEIFLVIKALLLQGEIWRVELGTSDIQ